MLVLCSVRKSTERSFVLLVILFLVLRKAELLALSDCVELFPKPRSSAVYDLYFWSFIVGALIDLICQNMPKISYEGAGNQSFEMREVVCLCCCLRLSLFVSPGFVFVWTDNKRGV